ncbi:MAG TPA: rhodanese-like domain-containing protein [Thermodesulfobacteriota bacterium]|nr:rhodanese-like domain-containing protein [Thermodesulfobacteriota bacterium]
MKKFERALAALFLVLIVLPALSLASGQPKGIDSMESYEMVTKNPSHTFIIDVRSRAEYELVGHPDLPNGVANIPHLFYPGWEVNKDFVARVKERYKEDDTIITMCRSGKRAENAARLLLNEGFKNVFYMTDSFEGPEDEKGHRTVSGWKVNGLPYTYELKDDLVYR